ncbi:YqjF family protein [Haloplanus aerogenes]|uniref:DUF2071 domain-containing protein n=1 Tax=Haloplanus aerogenes TaxID=660522 RepID=A0A3M0DC81_9EURY|nr:DUF2071 domain-containing protein [Haloplanus aerogenes]RMB18130.1 hypothetical protein ATH50_1579 [Haloplanus aerogenes]
MPPILTVTGRDVLFAHWPLDPATVESHVPDALDVATFDGSAWVSALALENRGFGPGTIRPPPWLERGMPQLNLRTYVTLDGQSGVYFLSLDAGERLAAWVGRRAFGLPFHRASMRLTRRGDTVTFRSRRDGEPSTVFQARYRPTGEAYQADPDSIESFCIEHLRYFLPESESRHIGNAGRGRVWVGELDREPWTLRPVDATIRRNTLFEAVGLPTPTTDPVVQYSPGFEMELARPVARSVS